jgi:hypothetical protein
MLPTYTAVLRDGRIEWTGDPPRGLTADRAVRVHITLLEQPVFDGNGERLAAALQRIADAGGLPSIPDPAAWEREQRQDRPLPGREP